MMYFTLCNPPQTIWNLAKPHFLGRFHHKGKHSFENVAKGVSLILKQGHSIASFQHGVLESRSTWMSPEASLRIWMPAIHAGMTNAGFSCSVGERNLMNHSFENLVGSGV